MNGAQLHLIVNHIAVIGVPLSSLLLAWALARKQPEVTRAALGLLAVAAASVALAYFTGKGAEEVVERYGVSDDPIERHEEFARLTALVTGALALLALGALFLMRRTYRRGLGLLVLAAALPVMGMLAWTGHLGGEIQHPEIRPGAAASGDAFDDEERDENGRGRGRGRGGRED